MINRYFVVEGVIDKFLLERLLPQDVLAGIKFFVGNGYTTAISKARSLLVASDQPVAILVDSDSTDVSQISQRKEFIEQFLNQLSSSDHFDIFIAVPALEILFFKDRKTLEKLLQSKVSDKQWEFAQQKPGEALRNLLGDPQNLQSFLESHMTVDVVKKLRNTDLIQAMIKKLS